MSLEIGPAEMLVEAIRSGDLSTLEGLLRDHPELASAELGGDHGTRRPLQVVTDWPGYFPNGPEAVRMLVAAGADPDGRDPGDDETPLHWAASSDDVDVARALIDAGADLNTPGGSIGTPLANAVGYQCWHVARLLVDRGACVDEPWLAAALGLLDRLTELLPEGVAAEEVSKAFWHACAGGQRRAAEYLLHRGADIDWVPDYTPGWTPLDAAGGRSTRQRNVLTWLKEIGARSASRDGG